MSSLPRIFISAASKELGDVRQHVTNLVLQQQCYPVVEEGFEGQSDDVALTRFLKLRLQPCDAVIHLAGRYFGGESPRRSSRSPRLSWTQMEYQLAKRMRKKILVGLSGPKFGSGHKTPKEAGTLAEQKQKTKLQQQHYAALEKGRGLYYAFNTATDLTAAVTGFLAQLAKPQTARKVKVLFVAAERDSGLDLRGQLRIIQKAVRASDIIIQPVFDAPAADIIAAINRHKPDIIHLSGRQDSGCIQLHNSQGRLVPFDANRLADALASANDGSVKLVVLDTCYSMHQAKRLVSRGLSHAIGIYDAIADDVATKFSGVFYNDIAAGHSLAAAIACASSVVLGEIQGDPQVKRALETDVLEMPFAPDLHLPRLISAPSLDASLERFR